MHLYHKLVYTTSKSYNSVHKCSYVSIRASEWLVYILVNSGPVSPILGKKHENKKQTSKNFHKKDVHVHDM